MGGFDSSISGWGKEDVDLFDKFVRGGAGTTSGDEKNPTEDEKIPSRGEKNSHEQFPFPRVFRASDPHLVHVYHVARCEARDLTASQYRMCVNSRADTLASVQTLGDFLFKSQHGT